MKLLALVLTAQLFLFPPIYAQNRQAQPPALVPFTPIALLANIGGLHHRVSTKNAQAQRYFNQGLALLYAFNEADAARSFRQAAELDPQLAMAYWGWALALENSGPPRAVDARKEAAPIMRRALSLPAPTNERAYVEALAKLIIVDQKTDPAKSYPGYEDAMRELSMHYAQDSDAATLYAASILGTPDCIGVLESVLQRDPTHLGANHLYIHAVESSLHPERALASAERLRAMKLSEAMMGHLVHMPSHIYMRTGNYRAAAQANEEADALPTDGLSPEFKNWLHMHNARFLIAAYSMSGQSRNAVKIARRDLGFLTPLILVRFHRWADVLKLPTAQADTSANLSHQMSCLPRMSYAGLRFGLDPFISFHQGAVFWARGMAFAAAGKVREARAERDKMLMAKAAVTGGKSKELTEAISQTSSIMDNLLRARIAQVEHNDSKEIEYLRQAVTIEDGLPYTEPPIWFIHTRESLGGMLLRRGDFVEAEKVFRADLEKNRRSGRSLYGLIQSLKGQGKRNEAQAILKQFENAWMNADVRMRVRDL